MATLPPKLYFRIGEVAGLVGVEPHVLRYWEREFRSIRPTKSATGQRVYSRKDVENLMRVRELLYAEGFTIAGAKKKLARTGAGPQTTDEADDDARRSGMFEGDRVYAGDAASEPAQRPLVAVEARGRVAATALEAGERASHALDSDGRATRAEVRATLLELRSEIEAFLAELGG
jgi:DNA-binding transcriptional MerR regulator